MEKSKNSAQSLIWLKVIFYIFLAFGLVFACFFSPYFSMEFKERFIPWTFLPKAYPNAFMMYTDIGSMGNSSNTLSWYYCTNASIEDLQVFFAPQIDGYHPYNYDVEGFTPHSGYGANFHQPIHNFLSDIFWEYSPSMTLLLRRTHPDCTSGTAYRITIIYPSEY